MLRRADFENDGVAWRVANPSSFGYHHGPVPYPNQLATASDNVDETQSPPLITISKVNTGVCDVEVDGTGTMCGTVFTTQPAFRRHLRDSHPGAAKDPTRTNVSVIEQNQGENSIKRWVLTGGWRDARYVREPGRGPEDGLVARYADACERIAREDEEFKKKFGELFLNINPPLPHVTNNLSAYGFGARQGKTLTVSSPTRIISLSLVL